MPMSQNPADNPANMDPRKIETLRAIMKALRTPVTGCPWDLEQDFASIAPYTIEEAYEVADAIETILDTYLQHREPGEEFLATYRRLGPKPFKEALYGTA